MARRKKGDGDAPAETNGVATEFPPENAATGTAEAPPEVTTDTARAAPTETSGTTETNRPCKTFSCAAAANVYVEASVWPKVIKIDEKDVTVYSATVRKSYRRDDGTWGNTNFLRGSEIPVAVHVLTLAATWIMQQRTTEDPPF